MYKGTAQIDLRKGDMIMSLGFMQALGENLQFAGVSVIVIAVIIMAAKLTEQTVLKNGIGQIRSTRYITICGMFGALAMLLHIFDFPVVFLAPGFYKLDLSEIPVMIGAFYLGPVGGAVIEVVKILLKLVVKGTSTAFVGDLANFIIGCSFVIPASIVYHLHKTRRMALAGLVAGTAVMTIFGSIFNALYLIPAFSNLYGMPLEAIIAMGSAIHPSVNSVSRLALLCVAPLNLLKGILISAPTMVLYKRISKVLHNAAQEGQIIETVRRTQS